MPAVFLPRSFYARPTVAVAQELLGCELISRVRGAETGGIISETEAYAGENDTACHARSGRTPRNEVMWGEAGHAYIYFTYGMHWMLNVVTEREGFPAAVLIRALIPTRGIQLMRRRRGRKPLAAGPAQLCQALGLSGRMNGWDLCRRQTRGTALWIARRRVRRVKTQRLPRVGIDYASPRDCRRRWRFLLRTQMGFENEK